MPISKISRRKKKHSWQFPKPMGQLVLPFLINVTSIHLTSFLNLKKDFGFIPLTFPHQCTALAPITKAPLSHIHITSTKHYTFTPLPFNSPSPLKHFFTPEYLHCLSFIHVMQLMKYTCIM